MSASLDIIKLPYSFAKKHQVILVPGKDNVIEAIYLSSTNIEVFSELERILKTPYKLKEVSSEEFQVAMAQTYHTDSTEAAQMMEGLEEELDLEQLMEDMPQSEDLLDIQDDAPVIRLLNALFTQAIKQKASDIHIETFEEKVKIRMRIDGVMHHILEVQRLLGPLLRSRVKVMAKLDISEKRIPQDGRISLKIAGHNVDVRVSTMPTNFGERIVMRILDKKSAQLDLSLLGISDKKLLTMRKIIKHPHGIILVTGPTGSGKTTTLYAMLTELNESTRNILTIEDPIEYDLPGIGQTGVNEKVNMSFAKGLRAILRQDPDIVMIGEIRDIETAEIAVQASLTGHLVLSTLHTNTAIGAISRLRDMGVESFLLGSSIVGLIAQRLVRRLCDHCKVGHQATPEEMKLLEISESITIYQAKIELENEPCSNCQGFGYKGRVGIYEIVTIDDALRAKIHKQADEKELETYARQNMPSINIDGFNRVKDGITCLTEVLRVTR